MDKLSRVGQGLHYDHGHRMSQTLAMGNSNELEQTSTKNSGCASACCRACAKLCISIVSDGHQCRAVAARLEAEVSGEVSQLGSALGGHGWASEQSKSRALKRLFVPYVDRTNLTGACRVLLEAKACPDAADKPLAETPLMEAAGLPTLTGASLISENCQRT